ncbi:MAG: hypothetical protein IPM69_14825 [Ignavibacteria bacterium]|nr:hypothetical protein [Ignavibacteria bacterium]
MELEEIKITPKAHNESFKFGGHNLNFRVVDFWIWNQSNLIENRNRGILAEFIVRQALEITTPTRLEWDSFDLLTDKGVKIEVKSAAYIQSWKQRKYSNISFDISKTKSLLLDNKYSTECSRQSNIYIFCLLHHQEQQSIDPLNLEQWTFYIVPTEVLEANFPIQKTISLSTLERISMCKCNFGQLKENFELIMENSAKQNF